MVAKLQCGILYLCSCLLSSGGCCELKHAQIVQGRMMPHPRMRA